MDRHARYASLYIRRFRLSTVFREAGQRCSDLQSVADRLRWLRSQRGLRQVDAAEIAGVSISVYKKMERGDVQHIALETVQRLGNYYGVPAEDFLDEFNRFLSPIFLRSSTIC